MVKDVAHKKIHIKLKILVLWDVTMCW